jgi:hypothetical protein
MGGRKKTFRLNPMVGAPLRRKARRAFGVVGVVVMLALASTMVLIEIAFGLAYQGLRNFAWQLVHVWRMRW